MVLNKRGFDTATRTGVGSDLLSLLIPDVDLLFAKERQFSLRDRLRAGPGAAAAF